MSSERDKLNLDVRKGYQVDQRPESELIPLENLSLQEKLLRAYGIDNGSHRKNFFGPSECRDVVSSPKTSEINRYLQDIDETTEPAQNEEYDRPIIIQKFHRKRKTPKHSRHHH